MEKELILEAKEQATSVNIKDFSPEGARFDITLSGKVNGKVSGIIMTTHNVLAKPDGSGDVDFKSMIFSEGEPIFVWGKATAKMVDPAPTEQIMESWTFQTPSKKLAYLNTTKGSAEAQFNLATGEYHVKVYAAK